MWNSSDRGGSVGAAPFLQRGGGPAAGRYGGPERRRVSAPSHRDALAAALEEVDYGILLVEPDGGIVHANDAAARALDAGRVLRRQGRQVEACGADDAACLHDALRNAARRRLRTLLMLGDASARAAVAVLPLGGTDDSGGPLLLLLGRRELCEPLSVQGFARAHDLTGAETRVLAALCEGAGPQRIADETGVAISTVRTQIGTIRQKTGASGLRSLVGLLARLPPLRGVLRSAGEPPRCVYEGSRLI